ncbi:MAG: carbohydrate ABC transporter permease, partial [Planctomycetia bacterium]|nr:carbohydrate ABC transporter permease [Planctomycetia bacterium]
MTRSQPHPVAHALLVVAAMIFAFPLLWMVLSSLKPSTQLVDDPYSILPREWRWSNYVEAIQAMPFLQQLRNTLLLAVGSVVGSVLSCSLVAYGF